MRTRVTAALVATVASTLLACTPAVARAEVTRTRAPDGALDAVVVVSDPGATGAPGYFVYLLPRDAVAPSDGAALRIVGPCCDASGTHYGLDVRWTGTRELTVRYRDAAGADPQADDFARTAADGTTVVLRVRPSTPKR